MHTHTHPHPPTNVYTCTCKCTHKHNYFAHTDSDYSFAIPTLLELSANASTVCAEVGINRDGIYEAPEFFYILLSTSADNTVVDLNMTIIHILDSDGMYLYKPQFPNTVCLLSFL